MTGFGVGHYEDNSIVVDVELKSFNSRYFELNTRSFDLSGESEYKIRTFLKNKLKRGSINLSVKIDSKDKNVQKILDEVKDREFSGYSYDGADASFELLANRLLGKVPEYLKVESYNVNVSKSDKILTKANVVFLIDGKKIECNGEGNGPVNALDNAIRSNFSKVKKYSNFFSDLKLLDYKVRILNTGTEATTRVLIESTDKSGVSWFTVGVSPNIIEASFKALIDSLDYKLYKEKAPANLNEK